MRDSISVWLLVAAILIVVGAFVAECAWGTVPSDSSIFRYIGRQVVEGKVLYRDVWDNKGPVLFLPAIIGYALLPWGTHGPGAVSCLMWCASVLLMYQIGRRLLNSKLVAGGATVAFVLLAVAMGNVYFQYNQEAVSVFFALFGLWALLRRGQNSVPTRATMLKIGGLLAFGASAGCVFLIKPNLLSFALAVGVVWVCDVVLRQSSISRLLGRIFWASVGFVGVVAGVSAVFVWKGALYDFWDATLLFGLFEYCKTETSWFAWWGEYLRSVAGWKSMILQWLIATGVLFVLALKGVGLFWKDGNRRLAIFVGAWMVCETIMAVAFKTFYVHYLIVALVPICWGVARLLLETFPLSLARTAVSAKPPQGRDFELGSVGRISRLRRQLFKGWVTILLGGVFLISAYYIAMGLRYTYCQNRIKAEIVAWAKNNIGVGATVVSSGGLMIPELLDVLRLKTPQRYFNVAMNHRFAGSFRRKAIEDEMTAVMTEGTMTWLLLPTGAEELGFTVLKDGWRLVVPSAYCNFWRKVR